MLMGFWGLVNVYTLRVSLSVAIVAMVEPATVTDVDNVTSASPIEACPSRTPEDHANVSYEKRRARRRTPGTARFRAWCWALFSTGTS